MLTPLFAAADSGPTPVTTIDAAITNIASFLDDIAKDTPWLTDIHIGDKELWQVLAVVLTVAIAMTIGRIVRFSLHRAAAKAEERSHKVVATTLTSFANTTGLLFFALGLPIGIKFLKLDEHGTAAAVADTCCSVLFTLAIGWLAYCLVDVVDYWFRSLSAKTVSRLDDMLAPLITKTLRVTIGILVGAEILIDVSGKQATSIIAGLGVGGLAIGLAAQDTIKNIFGSVMIFGDRPFELGDEIIVDGTSGTVETVGFRSTRFRTGAGHVVTIPNGDLANKAITNVSRRRNLSRTLNLLLPIDLSSQKMEQALEIVKSIVANHDGLLPSAPPKVAFSDITPTALNLQIQYWCHPPDGNRFAALNERVNLEILRRFQSAGIPLSVPRQRIELEKAA